MFDRRYGNSIERRKWQNPELILNDTGLKTGMTFADIGCGNGFFTLPAARITGQKGTVYGIDVNPGFINELQQAAQNEGLRNLVLQTGKAEDIILCRGCADIIFFGIVLHDFDNPSQVLQNAREAIKSKGLLVNLDWKKVVTPFGPPLEKRFSEEKASQLIEAVGFKVKSVKDSGAYHYLITAGL